MTYLVDSDYLADWLIARPDAVATLEARERSGLAISGISYIEVLEGILGSRDLRRGRQAMRTIPRRVRVRFLVLSRPIAERAATIRLDLRHQKHQVNERTLDILIAATALEHRLTLVTRNTRDDADVPGVADARSNVAPASNGRFDRPHESRSPAYPIESEPLNPPGCSSHENG